MKKLLVLLPIALALGGCKFVHSISGPRIVGSGKVAKESRTIGEFRKIDVRGGLDVRIECGKAASATLEGEDNLLPLISTKVSGDTLTIDMVDSYTTTKPLIVRLATQHLDSFELSGSGNCEVRGVDEKSFDVDLSGSGKIQIEGKTAALEADISGSGRLQLDRLIAQSAEVSISGSGGAEVHATDSLSAEVSGSGRISYLGNPKKVDRNITGSGSINAR